MSVKPLIYIPRTKHFWSVPNLAQSEDAHCSASWGTTRFMRKRRGFMQVTFIKWKDKHVWIKWKKNWVKHRPMQFLFWIKALGAFHGLLYLVESDIMTWSVMYSYNDIAPHVLLSHSNIALRRKENMFSSFDDFVWGLRILLLKCYFIFYKIHCIWYCIAHSWCFKISQVLVSFVDSHIPRLVLFCSHILYKKISLHLGTLSLYLI